MATVGSSKLHSSCASFLISLFKLVAENEEGREEKGGNKVYIGAVELHHFDPKGAELPILPPDLAERESYVRELLLEGFVHVLLEV